MLLSGAQTAAQTAAEMAQGWQTETETQVKLP